MKMPLIKTTGSLTAAAIILTVAGMLVGGIEKTFPKAAKQKAAKTTAKTNMAGLAIATPKLSPIMMGTTEIASPKVNEARISTLALKYLKAAFKRSA